MKPKVIAILCADIHLSHKPPIWRSNEPDWYAAMQRPLNEIEDLSAEHNCPVLCAGDIFDKWNSPAELINWAMLHLPPRMYVIPGQHDLPEHNIDNIYRSAYETLVRANKIKNIEYEQGEFECGFGMFEQVVDPDMFLWGFPFGTLFFANEYKSKNLKIAIVHDYVWIGKHKYPNAPEEKEIPKVIKKNNKHIINGKYYGYDVIVYGDNHDGFLTYIGDTTIFNCGTLMRRKSDEVDYEPMVGLLYSDGTVEPHYLDISKDIHLTADEVKEAEALEEIDMEVFADELRKLGSSALDFVDTMKRFWGENKTRQKVQDITLKAMEK